MAKGSFAVLMGSYNRAKDYHNTLSQPVKDCLNGNNEIKAI
jgi:hypothetical protein